MDIIDIVCVSRKYIKMISNRHISYVNNVTYWIKLSVSYINRNNKDIVSEYKRFLNQKDVDVIKCCLEHDIIVVPVIYQMNNDDIKMIIDKSIEYNNVKMLTTIYEHVELYEYIIKSENYIHLCIVKFMHKTLKLKKDDFQFDNNCLCKYSFYNNYFDTIKYLHKKIGYSKEYFCTKNNHLICHSCVNGHINILKYLHRNIVITQENICSWLLFSISWILENGHFDIVRYLHKEIGLTRKYFEFEVISNVYDRIVDNGHDNIVRYLQKEIGIYRIYYGTKS